MPTLQQILEQFDEKFAKVEFCEFESGEFSRDVKEDHRDTIKSFLTSTYKSIIQEEIDHLQKEIDIYTSYLTQMQDKKSYDKGNLAREILQDQINYLQNKLNEIE
jgi:hypothetical protein